MKNILKYLTVGSAINLLPTIVFGQINIFKTSSDFINKENYKNFKEIRTASLKDHFVLIDHNNNKIKIHKDSIWGYSLQGKKQERLIRIVDGNTYEIDKIHDKIVIYKYLKSSTMIIGDIIVPEDEIVIYFSSTLNNKPIILTEKNIYSNYQLTEKQIQQIKDLTRQRSLQKKNRKTNQYYLIEKIFEGQQ